MVLASRLPELSLSCTAPKRAPGANGAKMTFTLQVVAETTPLQVLPAPNVKSRLGAPCVSTLIVPKVVLEARLYGTVMVWLHGAGVAWPVGQTLALPKFAAAYCTSSTRLLPSSARRTLAGARIPSPRGESSPVPTVI